MRPADLSPWSAGQECRAIAGAPVRRTAAGGAIEKALARDAKSVPAWATAARVHETAGDLLAAANANRKLGGLDRRARTEYLAAVARLARRAEKHYKCPQDVEWAIDGAQASDGAQSVLLLQSRPETVWSRRPRQAATCNADPFTSMVQTLLHPSHGTPDGGC